MKKIILILTFFVVLLVFSLGFKKDVNKNSDKVSVVATLFPIYDMAKSIGGEKVDVSLLLPPGVEAHSFEPTPSDILKINNSNVFVFTSNEMEPWAKDIVSGISNKNVKIVEASLDVKKIEAVFHDADEPAGSLDPHIWLDFDNTIQMAENIKNAFVEKDMKNSDFYQKNYENYSEKISDLDKKYREGLINCKYREIVYGGHYALGYLAKRYNLKYIAASGVSPDSEPTAKDLKDLVNQINKNAIKYVFYEELTSPKIAETLAKETGAKMLLLNSAHNVSKEDINSNVTFFDILDSDLASLKIGLVCK